MFARVEQKKNCVDEHENTKKNLVIWTRFGRIGHPLMLCVFWYTPSNINKKKTFAKAHHYEKYRNSASASTFHIPIFSSFMAETTHHLCHLYVTFWKVQLFIRIKEEKSCELRKVFVADFFSQRNVMMILTSQQTFMKMLEGLTHSLEMANVPR